MCNNCEEELITTSQGPQGIQGIQGIPGINGVNGFLDWSNYDLSCWVTEGITTLPQTNDEISQDFIDTFCEVYQAINVTPKAVNDYRIMNQDTILYIQVIDNDRYYPDVNVTISIPPSNGIATIEADNKTIKYIPTPGFNGVEDFEYTITDPLGATSTAVITIQVQKVLTEQTIETTIINQLTTILASDDYWDLMFNLGDKILISNINLIDFDFTNAFTAGKGKTPGRYKKWAICNGNNGTEDLTVGTFRGFDHTNIDYNASAKTGGSDNLSITLTRDNIPPHKHTGMAASQEDSAEVVSRFSGAISAGGITDSTRIGRNGACDWGCSGADVGMAEMYYNSGDGTNNINDNMELKTNPDPINKDNRNIFKTVIVIQKISM